MSDSIKFDGKGIIDFSKLRSGLKKEDFQANDFFKSLFDKFNTDGDNILSRSELDNMIKTFVDLAGKDEKLSKGEAKDLELVAGKKLDSKQVKEVFEFLHKLAGTTLGVKSVNVNNGVETVLLEDGTKEEVLENGNKKTTTPDGKIVLTDKDGVKIEETIVEKGKTTKIEYKNGEKFKETITEEGKTTEIEYENNEIKEQRITTANEFIKTYKYDGKDVQEVTNRATGVVETFVNGEKTKTEDMNNNKTTVYDYNGSTETIKSESEETVIRRNTEGTMLSEKKTKTLSNGSIQTTQTNYNGEDYTKVIAIDGKNISKTKVVDGNEYSIKYDGNGNTDVVVQNGESIAALAKKFGCTVEDIINANGNKVKNFGNVKGFLVGEQVKIPREIEPDNKYLQGRKSAEESKAAYKTWHDEQLRVQAQAEAEAQAKAEAQAQFEAALTKSNTDQQISYIKKEDGTVVYYKDDKELSPEESKVIIEAEANEIWNEIEKNLNKVGTDEKALNEAIAKVYSKDILTILEQKANDFGAAYKADEMTSSLEKVLLQEISRKELRTLVEVLAKKGAYGDKDATDTALARNFVREFEKEIKGYTGRDELRDILEMIDNSPEARIKAEALLKSRHSNLEENEGSYIRKYLEQDGWTDKEIDQFDAIWIKNNSYSPKDSQEHRNSVINRLVFEHQDKTDEALHVALESIGDTNSEDYKNFEKQCKEYIAKNGIEPLYEGQDPVQVFLASKVFDSDEIDRKQVGDLSAKNTLLYKDAVKPKNVQVDEILYSIKAGDYTKLFESTDPEIYDIVSEKTGKSVTDLFNEALKNTSYGEQFKLRANAILSGKVKFAEYQIIDTTVELMKRQGVLAYENTGNGQGFSAKNDAALLEIQIKEILFKYPDLVEKIKTEVENTDEKDFTFIQNLGGPDPSSMVSVEHKTKDNWLGLLGSSSKAVDEEIFLDINGQQITDETTIAQLKELNKESLNGLREYVNMLEREHKLGVDAEGALSNFANALVAHSGLGTDREDVANAYREAKALLTKMEAAAEGRYRDKDGNVVSMQDLAKEVLKDIEGVNSNYTSSISKAKLGIYMAPIIAVTMVATGGAAAAGWGATATAVGVGVASGATSYGMSAIEMGTSYTGNTAEARENAAEDAVINAALTAIGLKVGYMTNNLKHITLLQKARAAGIDIATDSFAAAAADYIKNGTVSEEAFIQNLIIAGTASVAAHAFSSAPAKVDLDDVEAPVVSRTRVSRGVKGEVNNHRDFIADGEVARNIDQQSLNANQRRMVEEGLEDIPTRAELEAYQKEIAYQEPTLDERVAIDAHQRKVAEDYSEAHQIGNNSKQMTAKNHIDKTQLDKLNDELRGIEGNIRSLEQKIAGAKRFGKDTSALEKQLAKLQDLRTKKKVEIEGLGKTSNAHTNPPEDNVITPKPSESPSSRTPVPEVKVRSPYGDFTPISTIDDANKAFDRLITNQTNTLADVDNGTYVKNRTFMDYDHDYWLQSSHSIKQGTRWKIHLYANDPIEYANVAELAIPYLKQQNIAKKLSFKSVRDFKHLEMLRSSETYGDIQTGKAFTIYFKNEEDFVTTAKELKNLFDNSGLKSSGKVKNEAQFGESGFVSYRNEMENRLSSLYKPAGMKDPLLDFAD